MEPSELRTMIADYMENGFLENIIDMFKHDESLYAFVGDLLRDERFRVRIGITALVETLAAEDPNSVSRALPSLLPLLKDQNPMLRGDVAHLLGVIGQRDSLPFLREAAHNEDPVVRTIAQEAIEEIESKRS